MTILIGFCAVWLVMRIAPDTPAGQLLHRLFVEMPADRLSRITRGQILLCALLATFGGALVWLMEGDGLRLLSMAAPEIGPWIVTFEVTTWLDVAVALAMASSAMRFRAIRHQIRAAVSRWNGRRAGTRRARRTRRPERPSPANDDEERGLPLAA